MNTTLLGSLLFYTKLRALCYKKPSTVIYTEWNFERDESIYS